MPRGGQTAGLTNITIKGRAKQHGADIVGIAPGFADTAGPREFCDRYFQVKADIEAKVDLKP